jgi:hypothetical protein
MDVDRDGIPSEQLFPPDAVQHQLAASRFGACHAQSMRRS